MGSHILVTLGNLTGLSRGTVKALGPAFGSVAGLMLLLGLGHMTSQDCAGPDAERVYPVQSFELR